MINTMFLQIFFRRNPTVEQIARQANFLDAQAQHYTSMGNAAHAKREDDYAVYAYITAVDMQDTADELRREVAMYAAADYADETSDLIIANVA